MVQRASAAAGLNGHPGMMLSPTDMAALKDIDVDSPISPVDHDLEKNLGGAGGSALTTTVITTTVTAGRGF